jgi:hypothetical protein
VAWSTRKSRNYGWVIIDSSADGVNLRHYWSREHKDDATRRPKLEISYQLRKR